MAPGAAQRALAQVEVPEIKPLAGVEVHLAHNLRVRSHARPHLEPVYLHLGGRDQVYQPRTGAIGGKRKRGLFDVRPPLLGVFEDRVRNGEIVDVQGVRHLRVDQDELLELRAHEVDVAQTQTHLYHVLVRLPDEVYRVAAVFALAEVLPLAPGQPRYAVVVHLLRGSFVVGLARGLLEVVTVVELGLPGLEFAVRELDVGEVAHELLVHNGDQAVQLLGDLHVGEYHLTPVLFHLAHQRGGGAELRVALELAGVGYQHAAELELAQLAHLHQHVVHQGRVDDGKVHLRREAEHVDSGEGVVAADNGVGDFDLREVREHEVVGQI